MPRPSLITRCLLLVQFYPSFCFERLMTALGFWRRWDWIDPHVALGALPTRSEIGRLRDEGVRSFVNMCAEYAGRQAALDACGIEQLRLPTLDYHSPSVRDLARGVRFIQEQVQAGRKVFLHCKAGQGRSATLAIVYLAHTADCSPADADRRIRRVRRQITRRIAQRPAVAAALELLAAGPPPAAAPRPRPAPVAAE